MMVTVSLDVGDLATYLLPSVYVMLFAITMRIGWLYYNQFKKHKKSNNVKALSYFIWAVGFDALYSFIAILLLFVLGVINPSKSVVSPLLIMIFPNIIVLISAIYFYLKTIEVDK